MACSKGYGTLFCFDQCPLYYKAIPVVMIYFKLMISDSDTGLPSKVIVYSNTRERIQNFVDNIRKKMNEDPVLKTIDIITLLGALTKEEKARYIQMSVMGSQKHPELEINYSTQQVGLATQVS